MLGIGFNMILNAQAPAQDPKISATEKEELKKMRKDMNLTPEQKAKLKEIHKSRKANHEARKARAKAERMAENKATKAQVDAILTPEQQVKRDSIHKKRREFKKN